jgi:hypothetical protein
MVDSSVAIHTLDEGERVETWGVGLLSLLLPNAVTACVGSWMIGKEPLQQKYEIGIPTSLKVTTSDHSYHW